MMGNLKKKEIKILWIFFISSICVEEHRYFLKSEKKKNILFEAILCEASMQI